MIKKFPNSGEWLWEIGFKGFDIRSFYCKIRIYQSLRRECSYSNLKVSTELLKPCKNGREDKNDPNRLETICEFFH
jgi:hypothetical protein